MRQPRLCDIDGTVYDPDTGLPVARETKEQIWETIHTWQNLKPVTTDDPMKTGGSGKFVKVGDAADGAFCWDQMPSAEAKVTGLEIAVGELDLTPMEQQVNKGTKRGPERNATLKRQ